MLPTERATRRPPGVRARGEPGAQHRTPAGPAHAGAAAPKEWTAPPVRDRARLNVGLLACSGLGLLLTSEIVDRVERLEGNAGIAWLNLTFAAMLATIAVCAGALVGDSALQAVGRRIGHRPGARLIAPLLATSGTATIGGILVAHLNRPLSLDGWTGLAGSLPLLIAAVAYHYLPGTARPRTDNPTARPQPPPVDPTLSSRY
jgi:hypothetical protein